MSGSTRPPGAAATPLAPFAIVALLTVVAYLPSFSVPFQFDDWARITSNPALDRGEWLAAIGWLGSARVLPAITLALNYVVAKENIGAYHLVNLIVHLVAAFAVYRLAALLCRTPRLRDSGVAAQRRTFAVAAALLFACHPLQTQAVTYIIQRVAAMAAMFYIGSVAAYVAARLCTEAGDRRGARRRYLACFGLAVAALLSKENAVSLPLMLALTEVVFFGRRRLGPLLRFSLLAAPLAFLPLAWKLLTQRATLATEAGWGERLAAALHSPSNAGATHSALDYAMTQATVVPRYLGLLLFPVGLTVDHDVATATTLSPPVLAGLLLLVALAAGGVYAARRWPLLGYGILWLFLALSVESSFLPIADVMMEHRMYLAMPGPALLFAAAFCAARARWPIAATVAGSAIAALLVTRTYARNQIWQTPLSLWSDAALRSPDKARVRLNLGVAYHAEDKLDDAIAQYCAALRLDPEIPLALENIEIALEEQGRLDSVIERVEPKRVETPDAPPGAVVLEFDVSSVVCPPLPDR